MSELSWLRKDIPDEASQFFLSAYPDMKFVEQNINVAEHSGYKLLDIYTLPQEAWVEDFYDILEPRAKVLVNHPNPSVREFAVETVKEIEYFNVQKIAMAMFSTYFNALKKYLNG